MKADQKEATLRRMTKELVKYALARATARGLGRSQTMSLLYYAVRRKGNVWIMSLDIDRRATELSEEDWTNIHYIFENKVLTI